MLDGQLGQTHVLVIPEWTNQHFYYGSVFYANYTNTSFILVLLFIHCIYYDLSNFNSAGHIIVIYKIVIFLNNSDFGVGLLVRNTIQSKVRTPFDWKRNTLNSMK